MEKISDRSFTGETIPIDGKAFVNCLFDTCTFVFSGDAMFSFTGCRTAEDCVLLLDGSALRTINALRGCIEAGGTWATLAAQIGRRLTTPVQPKTRSN